MEKFSELRMTLIILVIGTFFISGCFFNNKHTVTFKTNGGSEISNVSVKNGATLDKVKEPKKEGYVFDGWYLEGEEFNFDTKVNEDITLVAKWIKVEEMQEDNTTEPTTESTTTSSSVTTKKKTSVGNGTTKKKTTKKTTEKVDKVNVVTPPTTNEKVEDKKDENVNPGTTTGETVNPTTPTVSDENTGSSSSSSSTSSSSSSSTSSEPTTEETKTEPSSTPIVEEPTTEKTEEVNPNPDKPQDEPQDEPVVEERNDKLVNLRIDAKKLTPSEGGEEVQTVTINKEINEIDKANVYTMLTEDDINVLLTSDMSKWTIKTNNNITYLINQEENTNCLELKGDNLEITSLTIEVTPIEIFILEYKEKLAEDNSKIIEWNLVRPVAETSTNSLDKQYHSDLQSAVLSASKDEVVTVKLLTDVEVKEEIEILTPVIIDGDGYKITKEEGYLFNIDKLEYKKDDELNINNLDLKINSMIKTGNSSFDNININNSTGIITGKTVENDEDNRINLNYSMFYKAL